jgi:hypothetical protein
MRKIYSAVFLFSLVFCFPAETFHYHKSIETLSKIKEIISNQEKGVYFRFGDGDLILANGQDDSYQEKNQSLQFEMQEALALNGPAVLKCLPLGCKVFDGLEPGMFPGNHEWPDGSCVNIVNLAIPLWNGPLQDIYSMTALSHCATSNRSVCMNFLKFLKASNCTLFVGNCNIPENVKTVLFGTKCKFIKTPDRNSYTEIDRIEHECMENFNENDGYQVIITSMGCSGRILQKRLWNRLDRVFLFDFGSLMDAICGWATRDWIYLVNFDANAFWQDLAKEF